MDLKRRRPDAKAEGQVPAVKMLEFRLPRETHVFPAGSLVSIEYHPTEERIVVRFFEHVVEIRGTKLKPVFEALRDSPYGYLEEEGEGTEAMAGADGCSVREITVERRGAAKK